MLKTLLERLRRDPLQSAIILTVVAAHFLLFVIALINPSFTLQKKMHKPLIVKTITPKTAAVERKSQVASRAQAPQPKPAPQKKQEAPKPQIQPSKAVATKPAPAVKKDPAIADKKLAPTKPTPVKKTPPPPPRAKISDSLLQELEESIAKIEPKSDKGTASKRIAATPKPITLQIDATGGEEGKSDYTDILVQHLHQALSLPDFGEVKIQLSLRQDGTVAKVVVLKAQSEKNKHYLESNLLSLRFPRLEGAYANKKEHTFTLTFCNEL